MKVHYPKLYNMAHLLSLNVFTASKGSNNYILFPIGQTVSQISRWEQRRLAKLVVHFNDNKAFMINLYSVLYQTGDFLQFDLSRALHFSARVF